MSDQLKPMPEDWHRGLAIVAHPDDVEYGASAAVAAWTDAGKEFAYVLASRGEAGIDTVPPERAASLRETEQRASATVVGVDTVEFLDYPDGKIEEGLPLRRDLAAAIRRHRPELVLIINPQDTWGDGEGVGWNQADHRAVGRAALDAVAAAGNRWIFPELTEQGLERWDHVRWVAIAGAARPTHAVDVTATFERGVASLLEHRAYIEALTDQEPETYVRTLLSLATEDSGTGYGGDRAVAFELVSFGD